MQSEQLPWAEIEDWKRVQSRDCCTRSAQVVSCVCSKQHCRGSRNMFPQKFQPFECASKAETTTTTIDSIAPGNMGLY